MIDVRPGAERSPGGEPGSGIRTLHAFSFGRHYDPDNLSFGLLTACNEEHLAPGAGFAPHLHRDVEIVTWVIEGRLTHQDAGAPGSARVLGPGSLQRLSAGSGVRHVERNDGPEPLRFLQMWLHPAAFGGEPRYDAAPDASGPLRQPAATLHVRRPAEPDRRTLPAAPYVYVHLVRGALRVGDQLLGPGDAARIAGEADPVRVVTDGPAEYLVWEMHAEPSYG